MNLLAVLPEWFTSWGWIVIVVAALVIIALVIFLIVRTKKAAKAEEAPEEEQSVAEPDEDYLSDGAPEGDDVMPEDEPAEEQVEGGAQEQSAEEQTEDVAAQQDAGRGEKARPANKVYHIAKRKADGKWQVKIAGGAKAIKLFNTQLEAIDFAKKLAENQEPKIVIHKEDGTFRRLTYHKKK